MVGYADPCPLCGNNKRRRFGAPHSRSDDGPVPCLPPLPPARPRSISDPHPLPAFHSGEIVPSGGSQKPTSPAAAAPAAVPAGEIIPCGGTQKLTSHPVAAVASAPGGADQVPSPPKTSLSRRPGFKSTGLPESCEDSNRLPGDSLPPALPCPCAAAPTSAIPRTSCSSGAFGSRGKPVADADRIEEEEGVDSNSKKEGREAPCAAAKEEEEMAAMRVKCKCGRVQEFMYRQKGT